MKKIFFAAIFCLMLTPVSGRAEQVFSIFGSQGDFEHRMDIPASVTIDEINSALTDIFKSLNVYSSSQDIPVSDVKDVILHAAKPLQPALLGSLNALMRNLASNGGPEPVSISAPNLKIALAIPLEAEIARRQRDARVL